MARETLATLRECITHLLQKEKGYLASLHELTEDNKVLTARFNELKQGIKAVVKPPATTPTTVADLPKYPVFAKGVECPTHGKVMANKHGYCPTCYNYALGKKDQPNRYQRQS